MQDVDHVCASGMQRGNVDNSLHAVRTERVLPAKGKECSQEAAELQSGWWLRAASGVVSTCLLVCPLSDVPSG